MTDETTMPTGSTLPDSEPETGDHPLKPALWRGWRRKCPNCGSGPLLTGYLKVNDTC